MAFVAIIGAGEVGGALAHALASRDRIGEIRLIDRAASVAAGKALDLQQSGPVEGFRTRLVASADPRDAVGATATVIADPAGGSPLSPEDSLALLKQLAHLDSETTFVCALPSHRSLVERGAREVRIPRARLIGSAPAAYSSAVRALVGASIDISPSEVSLSVLGTPPEHTIVPWSEASIGGFRLEEVMTPAVLAATRRRLGGLWPPGPCALASATARIVEALGESSRRQFSCFVMLDGELGVRGRAAAMPVELGPGGVRRIVIPSLSVQERVALENALQR